MLNLKYAELNNTGSRWYVYIYAFDPDSATMKRKRYYINNIRSLTNRKRYADKLIEYLNNKLDAGWNPFINETEKKQYTSTIEALNFVLRYKTSYTRSRTAPEYKSRIKRLVNWIVEKKINCRYIFEFKDIHAIDFMNWLLLNNNISAVTFNNYLIDYRTFFNTLIKHKYINENPFRAVSKLPETKKKKQPFTPEEQAIYKEYLLKEDYDFFIISMYCYYCALRPNEIVQLQVKDVDLRKRTIKVLSEISKSKRQRILPIADIFYNHLEPYLKNVPQNYYICSKNFIPGTQKIAPTRIAEHFRKIAQKIGLPDYVFFYSLKDTCADRLIENGFSAKVIRDLFGHTDLATTDKYLQGINTTTDGRLRNEFPEF